MNRWLFALTAVAPPVLKPWLLRTFAGAVVGRRARIGWFAAVAGRRVVLGEAAEVRAFTVIQCDGDVEIGDHAIVSSFTLVYGAADLIVGPQSYVGPQSLINCDEPVRIGTRSALGARTMVYTHGSFQPFTEGYWVRFGPVTVGDRVWCAAGVFLHPGVTIGDDVFVNSRSVVSGDLPSGVVAEGFPARPVTTTDRLRRRMTPGRVDAAIAQMLRHFAEQAARRSSRPVIAAERGVLRVRHGRHEYQVACVPAEGDPPVLAPGCRTILAVNRPDWHPPEAVTAWRADFTTMRADASRDPVYRELLEFLKRYYGVQFRDRYPG